MTSPADTDPLLRAFERQRGMLWGLAYRMTGSAADADDVVQETAARMISARPGVDAPLAPWLTRVAMNIARDRLRRRRERPYPGPWLPEPLADTAPGAGESLALRESAGFAFLVACEVLTPLQRAVLLLREVFELTTRETAEALEISEANTRSTLHRARAALAPARAAAPAGSKAAVEQQRVAMAKLFAAVLSGDLAAATDALAHDVRSWQDAGGRYAAATRIVVGPERVARLLMGIQKQRAVVPSVVEIGANGGIGWWATYPPTEDPRMAPAVFMALTTDPAGRIDGIYVVSHPDKLARLRAAIGAADGSLPS